MFGFMKKLTDKDKEEKEQRKKDKMDKKKSNLSLTVDELMRLEEAKKSLEGKVSSTSQKIEKETTPVYDLPVITGKFSKPVKPTPPVLQPKPSKKSILKNKSSFSIQTGSVSSKESVNEDEGIVRRDIRNIISSFDKSDQKPLNLKSHSLIHSLKNAKPVLLPNSSPRYPLPQDTSILLYRPHSPIYKEYPEVQLPQLYCLPSLKSRTVTLRRGKNGDFGVSLRKGYTVVENEWRPVVLVESNHKGSNPDLLLGECILQVDDVNVVGEGRETIIETLKKATNEVNLIVQPLPEVMEFVSKQTNEGSSKIGRATNIKYKSKAKSDEELIKDKSLLSSTLVYLIHNKGFSLADEIERTEDKVKVRLESGKVLEVDDQQIEKANPNQLRGTDDLTSLSCLNECSVLNALRQRYAWNLIHTHGGFSLICFNSIYPLSIYSDKIMHLYRENNPSNLAPHIFSTAQNTYNNLMLHRKDQCILLLGNRKSGKTFQFNSIISYFLFHFVSQNGSFNASKFSAITTILESFSSYSSTSNCSPSNFFNLFSLDFDSNGQLVSASIQGLLFGRDVILARGKEPINVFFQFLAGVDPSLRKELFIDYLDDNHPHINTNQLKSDRKRLTQQWVKLMAALDAIGFTQNEVFTILTILSVIYHLGSARAIKNQRGRCQFQYEPSAEKAGKLLGLKVEELQKSIFDSHSKNLSPRMVSNEREVNLSADELLQGFIIGLYTEIFNSVIILINRSLSSNLRKIGSIVLLDFPGFQPSSSFSSSSSSSPISSSTPPFHSLSSLWDFFYNYASERFQNLFHKNNFQGNLDLYAREGVDFDFEAIENPSSSTVLLIDNPPQNLTRTGNSNRLTSGKGLLWLLDDYSLTSSSSSEEHLLTEILNEFQHIQYGKQQLLRASPSKNSFQLLHMNNNYVVHYDVTDWKRSCKEALVSKAVLSFLTDLKKTEISDFFSKIPHSLPLAVGSSLGGGAEFSASLRRTSSVRGGFMVSTLKKKSLPLQIKFQMDSLLDFLKRTNVSFIHCLLPFSSSSSSSSISSTSTPMDLPLVRDQLRSYQLLTSARLYKQGYPDYMDHSEFLQTFGLFNSSPHQPKQQAIQGIMEIMENMDVNNKLYKIGTTQVFMQQGVLDQLKTSREIKVSDWLVKLQAVCKNRLALKRLEKLRVQLIAIKCIERNVRKLMLVRGWAWWRLFTKVKPLLNVHRTEEELKDKEEELESMKKKLEKVEKERNELKQALQNTEGRLSDALLEIQEGHESVEKVSEMLENETSLRLQLDEELQILQSKYKKVEEEGKKMEMEMMSFKVANVSIENEAEEDLTPDDSIYKERYQRLRKDIEGQRKKLELEKEDLEDQFQTSKKILEKKVLDQASEVEEVHRQGVEMKRKMVKQQQQMNDLKNQLQDHVTRNGELEKKQRKFDNEIGRIGEEMKIEKQGRERVQREKDEVQYLLFSSQQKLKDLEMELELEKEKSQKLENQIVQILDAEKSQEDSWKVRHETIEMERKMKDLEEELDEQAGVVQQLEQAKLRLEMSQEKMRQQFAKEEDEREEEVQEIKRNFTKKLKSLEQQLDEEYEERQKVIKERKEIESKLILLQQQRPSRDKEAEHQLKRDLKRTKALLADAQLMLRKFDERGVTKGNQRYLKEQLEEAEEKVSSLMKAKKSLELEVEDLNLQLETMTKNKNDAEERYMTSNKFRLEMNERIEEMEEEEAEVMKKYKNALQQHSLDLIKFEEQSKHIEQLQEERNILKEQISKLENKNLYFESSTVTKETILRLEAKIRDLEAKVDFEETTKRRSEAQLTRLKDQLENEVEEKERLKGLETKNQEQFKGAQRKVKEMQDEIDELKVKESDASRRKSDLERKVDQLQLELDQSQSDLKLAFKRIQELTNVLQSDLNNNNYEDEDDEDEDEDDDYLRNYDHGLTQKKTSNSLSINDDYDDDDNDDLLNKIKK